LENSVYPIYYREKLIENNFQGLDITKNSIFLGETIFTSFRTYGGKVPFLSEHIVRLQMGAQFLFQRNLNKESVFSGVKSLLSDSSGLDLRVRITFFKSNEDLDFFISATPLNNREVNAVKVFKAFKIRVPSLIPSYLKIGNYAETNLEIKRALENGYNDVLFLDGLNQVTECSTSNIFSIKGNEIYTPAVNGLFLNGITRQKIIEAIRLRKIKVNEVSLDFKTLLESDEIFICNSVKGIRSVEKVQEKEFNKRQITLEISQIFEKFIRNNCG
jgi:4-amino-4-deoxychorismate lyase